MKREVCYLIDDQGEVRWSDASTSPTALPDSRARWEAIWALRERLAVVAHSHPVGPLAFSREDETTMQALDSALGRPLRYVVVAPAGCWCRDETGAERRLDDEPSWAARLRADSGMT